MNKVFIIIKREYLVRVRTKAFIISTIASPLLLLAFALLPGLLAARGGGERHVTVLNQSGDPELFKTVNSKLESRGDSDGSGNGGGALTRYVLSEKVVPPGANIEDQIRSDYQQDGAKDSDKAYLIWPAGVLQDAKP